MEQALREHQKKGAYDAVVGSRAFAQLLTEQLQAVSHDKHLRVIYTVDPLPERRVPSPEDRARAIAEERRRNFAFERVERLDGNVGYIDLRGFSGSTEASETAVAAMNFLAGTDALIFDLTRNGGGSPAMLSVRRRGAPERFLLAREQRDAAVLDVTARAGAALWRQQAGLHPDQSQDVLGR